MCEAIVNGPIMPIFYDCKKFKSVPEAPIQRQKIEQRASRKARQETPKETSADKRWRITT